MSRLPLPAHLGVALLDSALSDSLRCSMQTTQLASLMLMSVDSIFQLPSSSELKQAARERHAPLKHPHGDHLHDHALGLGPVRERTPVRAQIPRESAPSPRPPPSTRSGASGAVSAGALDCGALLGVGAFYRELQNSMGKQKLREVGSLPLPLGQNASDGIRQALPRGYLTETWPPESTVLRTSACGRGTTKATNATPDSPSAATVARGKRTEDGGGEKEKRGQRKR